MMTAAPAAEAADLSERSAAADAARETAVLRAELAERDRRLAEIEAEAADRLRALSEALAAIEQDPFWRATAPLRRLAAALPQPARRGLAGAARGLYWALTPHKMPGRLRWMAYEPLLRAAVARIERQSAEAYRRLGPPLRFSYGPSAVERLEVFPAPGSGGPVFVFVHGGAWREGEAGNYAFPAEMFVAAGAHYVALDFIGVREAAGDPRAMAEQVRRGIAWVGRHASSFGGDPARLHVGGHSSGAHLCAVALGTDWREFGLPADAVKGALLMSGVFDMGPVRRSKSNPYLRLSDEIEDAMSPIRRPERVGAPIVLTCGSKDSPEFRRQSREFAAALHRAGRPARLIEGAGLGHMEMLESLADPAGANGRAALDLMRLSGPAPAP